MGAQATRGLNPQHHKECLSSAPCRQLVYTPGASFLVNVAKDMYTFFSNLYADIDFPSIGEYEILMACWLS